VTNARVLMFNNYFTAGGATGNATATIAGAGAQILSANNIYQGTNNPLLTQDGGLLCARGNFMTKTTGTTASGTDTVFVPAYSYTMLPAGIDTPSADSLAELITTNAGNTAGKNSVAPSEPANAVLRITASVPDFVYPHITGGGSITTVINPGATQPKPVVTSTNVPLGGNLTLAASATGFVAWQWYHDNFAIAHATTDTYAIANATTADAGAYSVALTATDGAIVTSGAFNVTVDTSATTSSATSGTSTPPPSSQSGNAGGGSGGGGGAASLWYAGALACLAALRMVRHNRHRA